MTALAPLLGLVLCVVLSAVFSGSETGLYSLSRTRVEAEAGHGHRTARIIRNLLRSEIWLLATLLVGNNLVNQAAALLGGRLLAPLGLPLGAQAIAVTLLVAPPILVLGELFPKDLFRRRPHALVGWCAPLIAVARVALAPLALPLSGFTSLLSRLLGLDETELSRVKGREAVIELLRDRPSELQPHVEKLARNVLELRSLRVERVMVPWRKVEGLRSDLPFEEVWRRVAQSPYSRLPVVDPRGTVRGYVHQLEVLGGGASGALAGHVRPMIEVEPDTPLDRALVRLRAAGQRAALVGTPARPLGLVTLKDLVEEISGELARW